MRFCKELRPLKNGLSLRSVTFGVNFGGKAANSQMIRKPEDLIKNLLRESDGKRIPDEP
jgi:hypothetical protein